ncbi:hypothetical protein Zmor_020607 [Zophobas morio]|uniref:Phosphatidic acid phosphatase type 2/haloperoxidase domain-containing protein n=1 Tax=Zophobas morio TaxID=2755281 RepID=A0AA38I3S6_9CUCU|nr:hypothetical protein Zmor_020607 [Zophobas morio]
MSMPKWMLYIAILIFVSLLLLQFEVIPNRKSSFKCKDPSISYILKGETISEKQLLLSIFLGPLLIITLIEVLNTISFHNLNKKIIWSLYKRCLTGVIFVILITEFLKTVTREPRPHFMQSCKPDANEVCEKGIHVFEYKCTNTRLTRFSQADLTRSFPSGHTSLSLFTALHCSYLLLIRLRHGFKRNVFKVLLITVCFAWSFICSLSRITDKRHHWWDVAAGATLGLCSFYMFYRLQRSSLINTDINKTESS